MSRTNKRNWIDVSEKWKAAYSKCKIGDSFAVVTSIAGEPDQFIDLEDKIIYWYFLEEWSGVVKGGNIIREMQFSVKDGIVVAKSCKNLDK